jgi:hypothetical protein
MQVSRDARVETRIRVRAGMGDGHGFVTGYVRGCRLYGCRPVGLRRFWDGSEFHCV